MSPVYRLQVHRFTQLVEWSLPPGQLPTKTHLYTSSVQDLHLPPRLLLQRQSYAYCQGYTLELSINYD